uniref:SAM domain-containing protein n=1 Tax=Spongospora subterranea TaxID=70186 RepID=A0A0H5QJM2_9EUKA|eukprot:CRZ02290.1 hypothetical protein [Spongospora subterranea]
MAPAESRPEKWDVDEVQQWLRSKGFSQYCVPFMLEDVDGPELAKMTKFGLMLLGISDTNLLRAIQLLFNDKPKTLPMPISDAKINLLIKDLNRTIVWLINRVGNLYELSPSKITELHRMITPSSPVRHSNEAGESPGAGDTKVSVDHKPPKISLNDFIQADTVELLERFVSGDTADDKKDITTLSQLTRAAAEAAAAKTGAQTKESIFNSVLKKRRFAEEARFDMKLKFIRRHDRIILPIALRKDDSEEDLKEDKPEKPKLPSGNTSKYLLLPTDPIRGQFDLLMMLLVLYFAITTPMNLAFGAGLDSNIYVEMSLNFIFVIDIVSNFFTAYTIEEGDKAVGNKI